MWNVKWYAWCHWSWTKVRKKQVYEIIGNLFFRLKGNEECVGGFDLIYRDGPIGPSSTCAYSTFLGAGLKDRQLFVKKGRGESKKGEWFLPAFFVQCLNDCDSAQRKFK